MIYRSAYPTLDSTYSTSSKVSDTLLVPPETIAKEFQRRLRVIDLGIGEGSIQASLSSLQIPEETLEHFMVEVSA